MAVGLLQQILISNPSMAVSLPQQILMLYYGNRDIFDLYTRSSLPLLLEVG